MSVDLFFQAASNGDVNALMKELDNGVDVNTEHESRMTAMLRAIKNDRLMVVNALIEAGADLNVWWKQKGENAGSFSPLLLATARARYDIVDLLLESGADANASRIGSGAAPIHVAAQHGDVRIVNALLAANADVNQTKNNGISALHCACGEGHVEMVNVLLNAGADTNQRKVAPAGTFGATALHIALQQQKTSVLRALVSRGCDVNAVLPSKLSPVLYATAKGFMDALVILLEGGAHMDVSGQNEGELNILVIATMLHREDLVRLVLQHNVQRGVALNMWVPFGGDVHDCHRIPSMFM